MTDELNAMQDEIQKAIQNSLPAQVGEALKKELNELAEHRANHPALRAMLDAEKARSKDFQGMSERYLAELAQHRKLAEREAAVTAREGTQQLRDLEVKLCEARRADALDLVKTVFRSPVYRENISGFVPVPVEGSPPSQYNSMGHPGMVHQAPTNLTKTTTQD